MIVFMKLSASTYSYSALTSNGQMTLWDCIQKTKEIGFDGIEFAGIGTAEEGCTVLDHAKKVREECVRVGLEITNYTIGADLLNGHGCKPEDEVARLKKEVDIAAALGAPGMRHDLTYGFNAGARAWRGFDTILPQLAESCRIITEYAASKGVRTMVENHGYFSQDSDRIERLVNAVAHENFGIICDMGNFLCVDEDPIIAVSRLAPYTFLAHAKDFHVKSGSEPNPGSGFFGSRGGNYLRGAIVGHGDVPVLQCLRILRNAGYNGYVSLEFEGMEDPILGVSVGFKNLQQYIRQLS